MTHASYEIKTEDQFDSIKLGKIIEVKLDAAENMKVTRKTARLDPETGEKKFAVTCVPENR